MTPRGAQMEPKGPNLGQKGAKRGPKKSKKSMLKTIESEGQCLRVSDKLGFPCIFFQFKDFFSFSVAAPVVVLPPHQRPASGPAYSIPSLNASSSLATAHNQEFWALAKKGQLASL